MIHVTTSECFSTIVLSYLSTSYGRWYGSFAHPVEPLEKLIVALLTKKYSRPSWNPKNHYHVNNKSSNDAIMRQTNQIYTLHLNHIFPICVQVASPNPAGIVTFYCLKFVSRFRVRFTYIVVSRGYRSCCLENTIPLLLFTAIT
jgi:hypothetical protein